MSWVSFDFSADKPRWDQFEPQITLFGDKLNLILEADDPKGEEKQKL